MFDMEMKAIATFQAAILKVLMQFLIKVPW